jgi:hypothetical protein
MHPDGKCYSCECAEWWATVDMSGPNADLRAALDEWANEPVTHPERFIEVPPA